MSSLTSHILAAGRRLPFASPREVEHVEKTSENYEDKENLSATMINSLRGSEYSTKCPPLSYHKQSEKLSSDRIIDDLSMSPLTISSQSEYTTPASRKSFKIRSPTFESRIPTPGSISSKKSRRPLQSISEISNSFSSDYRENCSSIASTSNSNAFHRNGVEPTIPKTPRVLKRPSRGHRISKIVAESSNSFKPNPRPRFLTSNKRPEVKPKLKTGQIIESHLQPRTYIKSSVPKNNTQEQLERTVPEPFDLGSVMKHEEYLNRIAYRELQEKEEDRRRRQVRPIPLKESILRGPTFVPSRSQKPLTQAVDPLPHAKERSERTLAFEARQRARMEEKERLEEMAKKQRKEMELQQIKDNYEKHRFRARPVPRSHYRPTLYGNEGLGNESLFIIEPDQMQSNENALEEASFPQEDTLEGDCTSVNNENMTAAGGTMKELEVEDGAYENPAQVRLKEKLSLSTTDESESDSPEDDVGTVQDEEKRTDGKVTTTPQAPTKTAGFLANIRNSLSPLLGGR